MYDYHAEDSLYIVCNSIVAPNEMWKNQVDSTGMTLPFQYEAFASQDNGSIELFMDTFKKPLIVGDSVFFFQVVRDLWKNKGVVKDKITADLSGEENGVYYLIIKHVNGTMIRKIILNSFD